MAYLIKKATHAKQCVSFTKAVLSTCQSSAKKDKNSPFHRCFWGMKSRQAAVNKKSSATQTGD